MKILVNNRELVVDFIQQRDEVVEVSVAGKLYRFNRAELENTLLRSSRDCRLAHAVVQGKDFFLADYSCQNSTQAEVGAMVAPMPGKIFKVLKEVGAEVKQGEVILIMEAMKMEHPVKAVKEGKIAAIMFQEGEQVAGGVELVVLESDKENEEVED